MCIVALAWQVVPDKPLVLLGNRDESYHREAAPLSLWQDNTIIAGRDLQSGGSWLGITTAGRWAVITNYREKSPPSDLTTSRGSLVADYLNSDQLPLAFLQAVDPTQYAGFNLIVGTLTEAAVLGNRGTPPKSLEAGIHGLSNALLNTGWPKVRRLVNGFKALNLTNDREVVDEGLTLLADETRAPDEELPNTGVDRMLEQILSPICIVSPNYGTRVSSVLVLAKEGFDFAEKTLKPIERELVHLSGSWH